MLMFIFGLLLLIVSIVAFIYGRQDESFPGKIVGFAALLVAFGCILLSCTSSVPTGHTGILSTFGKQDDNPLPNGMNFHAPWQTVVTISNKEQSSTKSDTAFSKDMQEVNYSYTIKHSVQPSAAPSLYKNVGINYFDIIIDPKVRSAIKAQIGNYSAEKLITGREIVTSAVNGEITVPLADYGINAEVVIDNFDFTDVFTNAVEAKQVAEQEKLRAKTEQERLTMEATQKAERNRIEAESAAEIARINAEADLEVQRINADAAEYAGQKEAAANKAIAESLTDELIEYQWASHWNGKLPNVVGATTPIVDMTDGE